MTKKVVGAIIAAITVALEISPYGAVLNFMQDPSGPVESISYYYSYFDPSPFGYANFGPFLTAIVTSAVLILSVIGLFVNNKTLSLVNTVLCGIALVTSLLPLMYGISYFTLTALFISILITVRGAISLYEIKNRI